MASMYKRIGNTQSLGINRSTSRATLYSGIDGTHLIDPKGICHAISAILDSMTTNDGDISRGARQFSKPVHLICKITNYVSRCVGRKLRQLVAETSAVNSQI
jgi:hypothetical protein